MIGVTTTPELTLVGVHADDSPERDAPMCLPFERRSASRGPAQGRATAFVLGSERFGEIVELQLIDSGYDGLGAIADSPLWPGTPVSLGFETGGQLARRGEVIRCLPCGAGYRIGIRLLGRVAA